jgi:hypothetical protein
MRDSVERQTAGAAVEVGTVPTLWEAAIPMGLAEPTPSRSPVEELLDIMENHAADEEESLASYRQIASSTTDPVVAFLMNMVLEDENRHHTLLERMAATLRDGLAWRRSPDDLPSSILVEGRGAAETIAAVKEFAKEERQGVKHLRALAREHRRMHGGLFTLLLETMALDSEKHELILHFIQERLEAEKTGA